MAETSRVESSETGGVTPQSPADLLVGQVLYDKYDVKDLVGRGGMGTVYRVRDWDWNVDLAVKVPTHHLISNWVAKERFVLEAQTWIELGVHPNIVQCWFVREYEGLPLVFMDYLPAGSLKQWRKSGRVQPGQWEQILDLIIQACAGLAHAHDQGVVHRDVKPANLLLQEDGRLCVTDFGLVKVTHLDESDLSPGPDWARLSGEVDRRGEDDSMLSSLTLTGSGTLLGTPEYGAPEQWQSDGKVGKQADIYALGGILFELCAGRRPFDDGLKRVSTAMLLGDHLTKPAPDPRGFQPTLSATLAELILRCLAKRPEDRPPSMLDLREELEKIFRDLVGRAYPRPAARAGAQRADALNNKAVSLWNLGFSQKAFDAWREASKLDGLHPETVYNRSMIQWRQGQIDDTEVQGRLTQIKTANPHLGSYLGYYYLDRGSPPDAEREIKEALAYPLAARHGSVWRALGDARMYLEEYVLAAEAYQQALQRMPEDRAARSRLEMAEQGKRRGQRILFPRVNPRLLVERRGPIGAVALSEDGGWAVHWSEDALEMWSTKSGATRWTWRDEVGGSSPTRLTVEPDWVVSLDSPRGRCWSRQTGQLLLELEGRKRFLLVNARLGWGLVGGEVLEQVELPGGRPLRALPGHTKSISCSALSGDSQLAITGSGDRTVRVWNLDSGECLRILEGHTDLVESVALTPDGATALSGGRDKTVRVWHVSSGDCLFVLTHPQDVRRVRLTLDGRYAVVSSWNLGEKDHLDVWEVATGQRLFSRSGALCGLYQNGPWALLASRVARPGPLSLWEIPSGRLLCRFAEHAGEVSGLALSGNDRWALTGSVDGTLRFWETDWAARVGEFSLVVNRTSDHGQVESTQRLFLEHLDRARQLHQAGDSVSAYGFLAQARALPGYTRDPGALSLNAELLRRFSRQGVQAVWQLRSFSSNGSVAALCLSSNGVYALSASGKVLYLWELSSGSCVRGFTGHSDLVKGVALSGDGQLAISVSLDGTLRFWNLHSGECLHLVKLNEPLLDVSIDRNGLVVTASRQHLFGCLAGRPDPLWSFTGASIGWLACSQDGRLAVTAADEADSLVLWKLPAGQQARPWRAPRGHPQALGDGSATALALSADGRYALSGDQHGWLRVFDLDEGLCKAHWQAHQQPIQRVTLSGDGRVALSASHDGSICCWDVASGSLWETLRGPFEALALSADARYVLSAGSDHVLRLWEVDWALNSAREARSLAEVWKKSTVLNMLGEFFRKR